MATTFRQMGLSVCSLLLSLSLAASARADAPTLAREPSMEAPQAPAYAGSAAPRADVSLAQKSLAGPSMEIVGGALIIAGGTLLGGAVSLLAGPDLFCGLADGETRESCDEQKDRGRLLGTVVGVGVGLAGGAVITHGAYRVRRVRVARRALNLPTASLGVTREHVGLRLGWRF
jgi:hypothetical protein